MSVIEEKVVSVTNREKTIEWKESGLILNAHSLSKTLHDCTYDDDTV